jgi:hypothetical protein
MRKLLLLLLLCVPASFAAQPMNVPTSGGTFHFEQDMEPVASLDGQWRFHPGDDAVWSSSDFDDSKWTLVETGKSWDKQGYPAMNGFAWYRAKLEIRQDASGLSLLVPYVLTSYQVFANGKLLGGVGAMPPQWRPIGQFREYAVYRLPGPDPKSQSIVLAFRVWHSPLWEDLIGGGIYQGVLVGDTPLIAQRREMHRIESLWSNGAQFSLALIEFLAACASFGFFLAHRNEREYLWFTIAELLNSIMSVATANRPLMLIDVRLSDLILNVLSAASVFALLCFFRILLGGKRNWLFTAVLATVAANALLAVMEYAPQFLGMQRGGISIPVMNGMGAALDVIPSIWVVGLLLRRAVQGRFDARLLLAPVLLQQSARLGDHLDWFFVFVVRRVPAAFSTFYSMTKWPFPISVPNVCDFLFLAGMLAIFVHRFLRTSRMEDAHQRELEAARAVQQVLVPSATPQIPGFEIESLYLPAGQVGGDFYQIVATQNGGALIVIGDVSGKGMPAAMTVSLLVGTFRTLSHYTQSPATILQAMNERMLDRSSGGFTTCLVMRVDRDGTLTAANAGHLAPYLNGAEIKLDNGLPLGLTADAQYVESTLMLANSARLALLTDGIVEARNQSGELFGFARAAAISTEPAQIIARAAQAFGQDDDITVLTLSYAAKEVCHA